VIGRRFGLINTYEAEGVRGRGETALVANLRHRGICCPGAIQSEGKWNDSPDIAGFSNSTPLAEFTSGCFANGDREHSSENSREAWLGRSTPDLKSAQEPTKLIVREG